MEKLVGNITETLNNLSQEEAYDILKNVKQFNNRLSNKGMIIEQVSDYYETNLNVIRTICKKYSDELNDDGMSIFTASEFLKERGNDFTIDEKGIMYIQSAGKSNGKSGNNVFILPDKKFTMLSFKAVLRMGIFLEDSVVAEKIRGEIVDKYGNVKENDNMDKDGINIIENGIVPVYVTDAGVKIVDGRELHEVLQSKQDFSTWVKKRLNECDAVENQDFSTAPQIYGTANGGHSTRLEYTIKLDTAKEMAMLERNEKGKQVRRYFIQVEEKYKNGECYNEEQRLMLEIGKAYASGDINEVMIAGTNMMEFKNRSIKQLEQENDTLTCENDNLTIDNRGLSGDILEWCNRDKLNAGVRKLAAVTGGRFVDIYNELYKNIQYKHHINLNARRKKSGNKKAPRISFIKDSEWKDVISTFCAMCEAYGYTPSKIFQQTTPKEKLGRDEDKYPWMRYL